MTKALFITGTGTDIGKTYVAALLVKRLHALGKSVAYYKAAMSGNQRDANGNLIPGDAAFVKTISGISQPLTTMCPYVYERAVSPHLASQLEGNPVDLAVVINNFRELCNHYAYIIVEGSGGICCPLHVGEKILQLEDVIKALCLSSILVATTGLGTINTVVLTKEYMEAHHLPLDGTIFNHYAAGAVMEEDNIHMCEKLTGLPTLAKVPSQATNLPLAEKVLDELFQEVKL